MTDAVLIHNEAEYASLHAAWESAMRAITLLKADNDRLSRALAEERFDHAVQAHTNKFVVDILSNERRDQRVLDRDDTEPGVHA